MQSLSKNKIILIIVLVILVLGTIVAWSVTQTKKANVPQEGPSEEMVEVVYSFSGKVSSIDLEGNSLVILSDKNGQEVKVNIAETTRLIKIGFPFDPANPPKDVVFTPTQTEVELSDFEQEDIVFVKSKNNISGKAEIDNIDFVQILP